MTRVDLHVHSEFSAHPSEWFLQKIGTRESYTEIEEVYRQAKARGMTYVTITDHNSIEGALRLVERHPEDTFVSAEVTAYFPEDGCKVHVLVYDITTAQFDTIQELRQDIYKLRDYLRGEDIACSVAHAAYSVNGRLTRDTMEKLLLLFNAFEAINGARGRRHNEQWTQILQSLTAQDIERMHRRHRIEPWGPQPWVKGFTGGSDDHAGLFIGRTFTETNATTVAGLMKDLRGGGARAGGAFGGHKALSFAIYKIACDFSRNRAGRSGEGLLGMLNSLFFEDERPGFKLWLVTRKLKTSRDSRARALKRFLEAIVESQTVDLLDVQARMDAIYASLARLTDDFFTLIAVSLREDLQTGRADRLLKNLSAALPALFMITPFFTTMRHLHQHDRKLLDEMQASLSAPPASQTRRSMLWFSDTVTDLNGVAVTMRELANCAARTDRPMKLVTTLPEDEAAGLPPNTVNLPCIYTLTPEFYTSFTLRLPSLLMSLDRIAAEDPTEIVVSTPGPVGLLGLAASRLLGVKCTGVYHTDFTRQADFFVGDPWVSSAIEVYTKWFFRQMDEIRVPTERYMHILEERGLDRTRMKLFRRGIESSFVADDGQRRAERRAHYGIPEAATVFMWAGRLGKEKNLDFLMKTYRAVAERRPSAVLLVVGEGPELERLKTEADGDPRIVFTGRVTRADLPRFYGFADVFVFPSTTDTFGMVVLEAQACGLPAVVTDVGGPQEIIRNGETGFVVSATDADAWIAALTGLADMKEQDEESFAAMRRRAREHVSGEHGWENLLDEMLGATPVAAPDRARRRRPRAAALAAAT